MLDADLHDELNLQPLLNKLTSVTKLLKCQLHKVITVFTKT